MDPISTIQNIYEIAKLIYSQVQLVKANNNQCKTIADRIIRIVHSLRRLESHYNKPSYLPNLLALNNCLNECKKLVEKFSASNWFEKILQAGNYQEDFIQLNAKLTEIVSDLQLDLGKETLINQEKDKHDQKADRDYIINNQKSIMQLQKEALEKMGIQETRLEENQKRIMQQFDLMKMWIEQQLFEGRPKHGFDPHLVIPYYKLTFEREIAQGTSRVYKGKYNAEVVAIKMVEGAEQTLLRQQIFREIKVLSRLRGIYIPRFYGVCLEPTCIYLVMEYMSNSSVFQALNNSLNPFKDEKLQKRCLLEIAKGLESLHQQGIIHTNLQSRHVLLTEDYHIRLMGLDLVAIKATSIAAVPRTIEQLDTRWIAPEILNRQITYSREADIFSFGVLAWEILHGKTIDKVAGTLTMATDLNPYGKQLVLQCCDPNPTKRPTLTNIIEHLEKHWQPAQGRIQFNFLAANTESLFKDAEAEYSAGKTLLKQNDRSEALKCFRLAAQKNHPSAAAYLGLLLLPEQDSNRKEVFQCLLLAARSLTRHDVDYNLARMYEKGDGTDLNLSKALFFYMRAANTPHTPQSREYKVLAYEKCQTLYNLNIIVATAEEDFNIMTSRDTATSIMDKLSTIAELANKDERDTVLPHVNLAKPAPTASGLPSVK